MPLEPAPLVMAGEIPHYGCCRPPDGGGAGLLVRRSAACAEVFLPAAAPATVISAAASWTFGAWVALGTLAQQLVLSYTHIVNYFSAAGLVDSTVELAYGDGYGGYTPLDATRELATFFNPGGTTIWFLPLSMMCQPVAVPANQAIYARYAANSATPYQVDLILLGWLGGLPAFDTIPLAAISGPGRWYPVNASSAYISAPTGAGWAWGAPVTVIDPAPNDLLVVGMEAYPSIVWATDPATMWQVGYGPAGSETWCATLPIGRTWSTRWVWPPVLVKAGERLALRAADATAGTRGCRVKVYDL
jgi:hypothetical protein